VVEDEGKVTGLYLVINTRVMSKTNVQKDYRNDKRKCGNWFCYNKTYTKRDGAAQKITVRNAMYRMQSCLDEFNPFAPQLVLISGEWFVVRISVGEINTTNVKEDRHSIVPFLIAFRLFITTSSSFNFY
jgi:hypothetical protein